jgi:hypothetical protein
MAFPNPNGRIEAGQPIAQSISARAWNRAQDAADIVLGNANQFAASGAASSSLPYSWAYLKNSSGDVDRGTAIAITGTLAGPYPQPVLVGSAPVANYEQRRKARYAITLEPIRANAVGRVAIDGAVHAKINMTTDAYQGFKTRVRPAAQGFDKMQPSVVGPFELLAWEVDDIGNPVYGDNDALVRFDVSRIDVRLFKTTQGFNAASGPTIGTPVPFDDPEDDEQNANVNVRNLFGDIGSGKYVLAVRASDGYWYAVAAQC